MFLSIGFNMNAVHRLYRYRKSLSTTTYKARGQRVIRCEYCRLAASHCICQLVPNRLTNTTSSAGFLLLMYDTEVLKPSNTGKLIANLVEDTFAFLWSRTVVNQELLAVLNDDRWQPFVVFPAHYAQKDQQVFQDRITLEKGKRPLFIMLDGSWREARKMFRKSPYLANFPIVSFNPNIIGDKVNPEQKSRYQIRIASGENQFATAEVAARMLDIIGESNNALLLDSWFDVFSYQYQKSVCQTNRGNPEAVNIYHRLIEKING
jgi:DTW domain-containing protein YfiP